MRASTDDILAAIGHDCQNDQLKTKRCEKEGKLVLKDKQQPRKHLVLNPHEEAQSMNNYGFYKLDSSCSTEVKGTPHVQEVVSSNLIMCLLGFFPSSVSFSI